MNFALSDEQMLLREAARGSLARVKTIEAARDALEDPTALPDLWPMAVEAGWPGVLISEDHGGAGLGGFDALLVAEECGRVLAGVPLLGVLPATAILNAAGDATLEAVAAGELRPAYVPARPPGELAQGWTVEPASGFARAAAPAVTGDGDEVTLDGTVAWVPDAPGADLLVAVGVDAGGQPVAVAVEPGSVGVAVETVVRYDATRSLGHVTFTGARGRRLAADADTLADAWYLAHALIAAESIGAVQTCLDMSLAYAKERFTFGRAIGSYQAVKHELTEILRRLENARGLEYYAGWAREARPEEFALAASAARSAAGGALDFAARAVINVHGGIGATWEHDAPLFFRRAQLSRRLLAGTHDATDRVAECTMVNAAAAA
ncbi:MAG TPA: acyl-CoA dehydrogenase family protein [Solirubrobacteraceae bacterium]|jgi:alkylation response protein AidB-like acyl-CoA dehydrogenase|nr:acyl-CoA dehydrogenase family protein [Solirubrobacteraceae bacterium]